VLTVVLFTHLEGGITQYLSRTIAVRLGDVSGDAYLIHEIILRYMVLLFAKLSLGFHGQKYLLGLIGFLLTIVAVKCWKLVITKLSNRQRWNDGKADNVLAEHHISTLFKFLIPEENSNTVIRKTL